MDLPLSILDGFISCKIYDKRDDFDFEIVNFPHLDGDFPRRASFGIFTLQLGYLCRTIHDPLNVNLFLFCYESAYILAALY